MLSLQPLKPRGLVGSAQFGLGTLGYFQVVARITLSYRIGLAANWLNDTRLGDVYVVSPPVAVTVP